MPRPRRNFGAGRQAPRKIEVAGQIITVRSKAEEKVARQLEAADVPIEHEEVSLEYTVVHKYIPDFRLPNGILIEVKGWTENWASGADRTKMIQVRDEWMGIDLRIVWSSTRFANAPIRKGSKTTNEQWARKNGFETAIATIPEAWLEE